MTDGQIKHLMTQAAKDGIYQDLQFLRTKTEVEYQRILNCLPPEDQCLLSMYVAIREDMESRLAKIAYFLEPLK